MLQTEIEDVENKYNQAVREIELKNFHVESVENILKRKEEEIARVNEMLFIYKNNTSKYENVEEENRQKRINEDNTRESNMSVNMTYGLDNNKQTGMMKCSEEIEVKNQTDPNDRKDYMSESGNRFLINDEKERELRRLINNYNLEKSGNYLKIDSSFNRTSDKKIPGKIYSAKIFKGVE